MRLSIVCTTISAFAILVSNQSLAAASVSDFLVYNYLDNNNNVLLPGRLHVPTEYATDPPRFDL